MKTDKELREIACGLLPIERIFFKDGKGWGLDRLSYLSREEYDRLEKIVRNEND